MVETAISGSTAEVVRQQEAMRSPDRLVDYVNGHFSRITATTAQYVHEFVTEIHRIHNGNIPPELKKHLKDEGIDGVGSEVMIRELEATPFVSNVIAGEGDKHKHEGKAAPSVKGTFGKKGAFEAEVVDDVIEETKHTADYERGGTSVLCVSTKRNGIKKLNSNVDYLMKLLTDEKIEGVTLRNGPHKNMHRILNYYQKRYGLKAEEISLIAMNPTKRRVNIPIFSAAEDLGIQITGIDSGDLNAGLDILTNPEVFGKGIKKAFLYTRGGGEEGEILATAVKILNGQMEVQEYFVIPPKIKGEEASWEFGEIYGQDELIPASPEELLLNASLVTDSARTGKRGIRSNNDGGHIATTMSITHKAGVVYKDTYLPPQDPKATSGIYQRNLGSFALPR